MIRTTKHRRYDVITVERGTFTIVPAHDRVNGTPMEYNLVRIGKKMPKRPNTLREHIKRCAKETPDVLA